MNYFLIKSTVLTQKIKKTLKTKTKNNMNYFLIKSTVLTVELNVLIPSTGRM